jgi:hypothetical protein
MEGARINVSAREYQKLKEEVRKDKEKFLVDVKARADKLEERVLRSIAPPDKEPGRGTRKKDQSVNVVNTIVVVIKASGIFVYVEDHKRPVLLRRRWKLYALLLALCEKEIGQRHDDGLVPIKSQVDLLRILLKKHKHEIDLRGLIAHVHRLRNDLEAAGLSRNLVETLGDGYRIRLGENGQVIVRNELD